MKLDLMKDKPKIDVPTLNWVWDTLWRRHACMKPRNVAMRAKRNELEILMEDLELEAEKAGVVVNNETPSLVDSVERGND